MIDKIFFILHNAYYRDGQYGKDETPNLTVCVLLGSVLFTWLVVFMALAPHFGFEKPALAKLNTHLAGFGCLLVVYFSFYFRGRHKRIYDRYKDQRKLSTRTARVIAYISTFLLIVLPFILMIIVQRIDNGEWIKFK